jgi:hypothetical protein
MSANQTQHPVNRGRQAIHQGGMYYPPGQNPHIQPYVPRYHQTSYQTTPTQHSQQVHQVQHNYVHTIQQPIPQDQLQQYQHPHPQIYTSSPQMTTPYPQMTNSQPQPIQYQSMSDSQSHAFTTQQGQGLIIQGGYSVAHIERPCYLYFVECGPNQSTTTQQQGQPQQQVEIRYTPATSNTGIPNSTYPC